MLYNNRDLVTSLEVRGTFLTETSLKTLSRDAMVN